MNRIVRTTQFLQQGVTALFVLLLTACAGVPVPDLATQRFENALRNGSEKFASGDLQQAANAFEQAERVATLYDRRALRVQALFAIGAVAATREQHQAALLAYGQALSEAHGLADAHSEAVARAGIADVQRHSGELDAALQGFELALAPDALRPGSPERMQATMGHALVWSAMGKTQAALDALKVLEAQARTVASPLLSSVLANQAAVFRASGDMASDIAKGEEALELDRRQSNLFALAADLELLGKLYRVSGRSFEAQISLERALLIVQVTGQDVAVDRLKQLMK